jgi:5-methyltetrahydrofolate--homocysteine methyltransferase
VFGLGPEEFARGIGACVAAGARFVGGCCGTTPAHLEAARVLLGVERDDPRA